jgi:hypothetical protein
MHPWFCAFSFSREINFCNGAPGNSLNCENRVAIWLEDAVINCCNIVKRPREKGKDNLFYFFYEYGNHVCYALMIGAIFYMKKELIEIVVNISVFFCQSLSIGPVQGLFLIMSYCLNSKIAHLKNALIRVAHSYLSNVEYRLQAEGNGRIRQSFCMFSAGCVNCVHPNPLLFYSSLLNGDCTRASQRARLGQITVRKSVYYEPCSLQIVYRHHRTSETTTMILTY